MSLKVKCYPYGPLGENTYLVTDESTELKGVIDPGYIGSEIIDDIGEPESLRFILLTHGHYDHFASARRYIEMFPDASFAVPAGESYLLSKSMDNIMMAGDRESGICPDADIRLSEGDTVTLGETVFRIIETPGHTEGGICYVTSDEVFTGDTLFRLSVGNTSFETGSWPVLVSSIQNKLYTLDEGLNVYSGHGEPTTIGFEKRANPFV